MALRAGNVFHFLFSATDQDDIDPATIVVEDVPYAAVPAAGAPYPQALRIRFGLNATAQGRRPRVRPPGPGLLRFIADPGKVPPSSANATAANYSRNWPLVGTMMLTLSDHDGTRKRFAEIAGLPVTPSHLWFSKVELSSQFLFTTLGQLRDPPVIPGQTGRVARTDAAWLRTTVAGFLKGVNTPLVAAGAAPADDDQRVIANWPMAVMDAASGLYELVVSAAFDGVPFDGTYADYETPAGIGKFDPAHPRFGAIPARLVYRALRTHGTIGDMGDAETARVPAEAILKTGTSEVSYFPIRFTRIWKPEEERSVYLPSQVVTVAAANGSAVPGFTQRLPSHGMLYVTATSIQLLAGRDVTLTLHDRATDLTAPGGAVLLPAQASRQMTWLTGGVPNVWQDLGDSGPLVVDCGATPHVLLRRRMMHEIAYDRGVRPEPGGAKCTYMSMRRAVRALVNNRVAGGRLNFECYFDRANHAKGRNTETTRALVREALDDGAPPVLNGQPDPFGEVGAEASKLLRTLNAIFPTLVAAEPGPGADPPTLGGQPATYGRTAYYVWQSGIDLFQDNPSRRAFADGWVGGGGPGALVVLGLAADYTVNPGTTVQRPAGMSDADFTHLIVNDMMAGNLRPGAALQFWESATNLTSIRARNLVGAATGHSPIFLRYIVANGANVGMRVIDQTGEVDCPVETVAGKKKLRWDGFRPDIWIASNWIE